MDINSFRFLEHALIDALIRLADRELRRAGVIALDQVENEGGRVGLHLLEFLYTRR